MEEHAANQFGPPDAELVLLLNGSGTDVAAETEANDFPEPEIDAKRAEKDAELAKYVQVEVEQLFTHVFSNFVFESTLRMPRGGKHSKLECRSPCPRE